MWGKLLIERAQLITQFESEVDDYPEHVCCSCECLYQRKSVTKAKLSDKLGNAVWPRLKEFILGQCPNTNEVGTMYMCNYCKSSIKNNKLPPRCVLNPFTATSHYCTTRAPLERATSHYCTAGSRGLFTAYLDLLVLRFSVHCSSAASLYILFHHHVYIFTYVSVAVRKTCLFVPRTCCDASTCSRTTQKRLHTSSKAI